MNYLLKYRFNIFKRKLIEFLKIRFYYTFRLLIWNLGNIIYIKEINYLIYLIRIQVWSKLAKIKRL